MVKKHVFKSNSTLSSDSHETHDYEIYPRRQSSPSHLTSIIQLQERYPALTADRLEKKNKLDVIKMQMMSSKRQNLRRRRSIASGHIFRPGIDKHQNIPPSISPSRETFESNESDQDDGTQQQEGHGMRYGGKNYSSSSQRTIPYSEQTFSEDNTGNFQSTMAKSIISPTLSSQKIRLRRRKSSLRRPGPTVEELKKRQAFYHHPTHYHYQHLKLAALNFKSRSRQIFLKEKRISKLLTISRTSSSTNKKKSSRIQHVGVTFIQQLWTNIQSALVNMANRVIDTRCCELTPTRMTVSDIRALATFMQALRKEPTSIPPPDYDNDDNDDDDENKNRLLRQRRASLGKINALIPRRASTELLAQEQDTTLDDRSQQSSPNESSSHQGSGMVSPSITRSYQKQRLGSLGKIFPFAPNVSRSASQQLSHTPSGQAQITTSITPSPVLQNTTPVVSPSIFPADWTFPNEQQQRQAAGSSFLKRQFNQLTNILSGIFNIHSGAKQPIELSMDDDGDSDENSSVILFDGWSLWIFSPSSKLRLYHWMIIASRWYEVFSLILLFTQWLVLTCVPIDNHDQKTTFSTLQAPILCVINGVVLFEMIAKIVVYGLTIQTVSASRPNIYHSIKEWIAVNLWGRTVPSEDSSINERPSTPLLRQPSDQLDWEPNFQPPPPPQGFPLSTTTSPQSSSIRSPTSDTANSRHAPWNSPTVHPNIIRSGASSRTNSPLQQLSSQNSSTQDRPYDDDQDVSPFPLSIVSSDRRSLQHSLHESPNNPALDFLKISHCPFLSSTRNILDLVSVFAFWLHILVLDMDSLVSLLAALSSLRILRFLTMTEGTTIIMQSLRICFDILCNVLGFFVFFWLLFSLLALFLFTNSFSRRCAIIPHGGLYKGIQNLTYANPEQRCNSYYYSETRQLGIFDLESGTLISSRSFDGYTCQLGQACVQSAENLPGWSHINYHNIFYSMLNIFTVVSTENWTDLMYMSQDSISALASSIFYCFCLYLMTFILVPMFIAVITTSFSNLRGTLRQSAFARNRKTRILLSVSKSMDGGAGNSKDHQKTNNENEVGEGGGGGDTVNDDDWVYEGYHGAGNTFIRRSHRLQHWLNTMISSKWFVLFGSTLVVINTVTMAMYSNELPGQQTLKMYMIECGFCLVFLLEIILRIFGSGNLSRFWHSTPRNQVDFVIIVGSLCNTLLVPRSSQLHQFLQLFVLARSYRLVYFFPGVLQLLSDVIGDGQGIINLTSFTFIVLFLFTPIAMQLFGGDFGTIASVDDPVMRFDNFYQSFLSLFQIMTGENWTDILYDAMESQSYTTVVFAGLFMLFLYFAIHYLVLNLFIAVIMENFDLEEDEIRQIQIKKYIRQHRWQPEYFQLDIISRFLLPIFVKQDQRRLKVNDLPQSLVALVKKTEFQDFLAQQDDQALQQSYSRPAMRSNSLDRRKSLRRAMSNTSIASTQTSIANDIFLNQASSDQPVKYGDEYELNVAMENKDVVLENMNLFRSMVLLKANNPIRLYLAKAIAHPSYTAVMMAFVCVSLVMAIYTDSQFRSLHSTATLYMEYIQIGLLVIFFLDILVRMVNSGVIMLPESYLRNIWNVLDFTCLTAQVVVMVFWKNDTVEGASILRCLRTLRIMHLVHYIHGMRVIFLDIMYGLPKLMDAVTLNLIVFIPFAIYGCFIFGGRFSLCNDGGVATMNDCIGEYASSEDDNLNIFLPRVWRNPYDYSFDTFDKALLHLFECASGEGWILSLFTAMSVAPTMNVQPKFDWFSSSIGYSLYYIVFMFMASLCTIQLFIGVFLETFKQRSGISSLTNAQRQFQDLQRQLSLIKPSRKAERPDGYIRAMCYDLVIDRRGKFAQMMAFVSMANILVFASRFLHQPSWVSNLQERLYHGLLVIYMIEILIKVLGLGPNKLTSSRWNIYDIVIVTWAITTSILKVLLYESFTLEVMYDLAQIGIAFRLAQRIDSLDTVLRATQKALPSIGYVTGAFVLVILCFAVIFQELFDYTRYGPYGHHNANFRSLPKAFLTLFRITTGENWDFLMHDFAVQYPDCVKGKDCGSPVAAYTLFIIFYVVCTYIFVNLFTVIVINNFSFTFDKRNKFTLLTRTDLRHYKTAWEEYDPKATGFIQKDDVPGFLRGLQGTLSMRIYNKSHNLVNLLKASDQMDADVTHLASVPLCSSRLQNQFASNNILGERYYNYYEVNKKLSTMDVPSVRFNKEEYGRIYQEIQLRTTSRGIAFHDMLQILALRLVDPTKSLTFVGFVEWSRQQDVIRKKLATEKATNAVNMLIQRRQYIKERQQLHNSQMMDMSLYADWPSPSSGVSSTGSSDYELKRHSSVVIGTPIEERFPNDGSGDRSMATTSPEHSRQQSSTSGSPVPEIIVDQPPQQQEQQQRRQQQQRYQKHDYLTPSPTFHPSPLATTSTMATADSTDQHGAFQFHPTHHATTQPTSPLETPHGLSPIQPIPRRKSEYWKTPVSPIDVHHHRPSFLRHPRPSQDFELSDRLWRELVHQKRVSPETEMEPTITQDDTAVDTFTFFYALDSTMDDMALPDVNEIVGQLEHNTWSDLLRQESLDESQEFKL